jgi:hypothetical protein
MLAESARTDAAKTPAEVVAALAEARVRPEIVRPATPPRAAGRRDDERDTVARYREPTESKFAFVATESVTPRPHQLTARRRRRLRWEVAVAVGVGLLWSLVAGLLAWTR